MRTVRLSCVRFFLQGAHTRTHSESQYSYLLCNTALNFSPAQTHTPASALQTVLGGGGGI